jgi:hypothetical protein
VSAVTGLRRDQGDEWHCFRGALARAQQFAADALQWLAKFLREYSGTRLPLLDQTEFRSIGYREDSRAEKDLFSLNAARIAPAGVLLVVHEKEFRGIGKKGDILEFL